MRRPGFPQARDTRRARDNRRVRGTIDLHCHILPGLDDGAGGIDDAIAMARQAQADGIDAICATPHIRSDHEVRIAELPRRLEVLREALRASGVRTRVLPGAEVAGNEVKGLSDAELLALSLGGGGRWILLEPEPGPLAARNDRAADDLLGRGLRPLIPHPERHPAADLRTRLSALVDRGALVQATAALFQPGEAREGMLELARAGLVHVLGSDSHSAMAGRPVALSAAFEELRGVMPIEAHLEWVAHAAPAAIVAGEPLTPPF